MYAFYLRFGTVQPNAIIKGIQQRKAKGTSIIPSRSLMVRHNNLFGPPIDTSLVSRSLIFTIRPVKKTRESPGLSELITLLKYIPPLCINRERFEVDGWMTPELKPPPGPISLV